MIFICIQQYILYLKEARIWYTRLFYSNYRASQNKVWFGKVPRFDLFINQLSNDFQQMNIITCKNLIHCGYFEYKTCSDNQVLTEIWLARHFDHHSFSSAVFGCLFVWVVGYCLPSLYVLLKMTYIGNNSTFTACVHMNKSMHRLFILP